MSVYVMNSAITRGPDIQWVHIDGPVMHWAGHMHWLTFGQILALLFRRTSVYGLGAKVWPHLDHLRIVITEEEAKTPSNPDRREK